MHQGRKEFWLKHTSRKIPSRHSAYSICWQWHACVFQHCIFNCNPAWNFKSACTVHVMQPCTHAIHATRTYTHTRMHARTHARTSAENSFSRTFCTLRKYVITGISKLKECNTWSAISRLQIDEIEKIQRGFEEYDFDFKISTSGIWITCFICSTILLLNTSFLHIIYEIEIFFYMWWTCVILNSEDRTWKLHLFALICFFRFPMLFGLWDIGRQN